MANVTQTIVETWALNGNLCEAVITLDLTKDVPSYIDFTCPAYGRYKVTSARYQAFGGTMAVELFKNADTDEDGTAAVSTRYCLCKTEAPRMDIRSGSTVNDTGTNILNFSVFGTSATAGQQQSAISNTASRNLNPGTIHLIKLTAVDAGITAQVMLEWAEV